MAGSIALSLTQQLDQFGKPLAGGKLWFIQAGTVATPQNAFQDSALTLPWPNPMILSASGRIGQLFFADGSIKIRLTDANGVEILVADGILVVGASSGGGGGSPVDPTTIIQTGWLQAIYGTGVISGFVRANGRTIGNATSGATERANADTLALYTFLYGQDANLVVSGGRGASVAADYAANKTLTLPDWRGRALAALDDMGNSAAGRLTATYFGATATVLGAAGGGESKALIASNMVAHTHSGTTGNDSPDHTHSYNSFSGATVGGGGAFGAVSSAGGFTSGGASTRHQHPFTTDSGAGMSSAPFAIASPMMLATIYLKL